MKQKRIISIKDARLRKIRNNFRSLWISATHRIWDDLFDDEDELYRKNMTNSELYQLSRIQQKKQDLKSMLDQSICLCPVCQQIDQDMVFNPVTKRWFCVDCYEMNRKFYRHTKDALLYP